MTGPADVHVTLALTEAEHAILSALVALGIATMMGDVDSAVGAMELLRECGQGPTSKAAQKLVGAHNGDWTPDGVKIAQVVS